MFQKGAFTNAHVRTMYNASLERRYERILCTKPTALNPSPCKKVSTPIPKSCKARSSFVTDVQQNPKKR
ncbi:hypothetical protein X975_02210, partial [Stegodyphus mimosarum]